MKTFVKLITKFAKLGTVFTICGKPRLGKSLSSFIEYIHNIRCDEMVVGRAHLYRKFCAQHIDSLKFPLQPLRDNLDSLTYEVMEEDPVKYDAYRDAIHSALSDLLSLRPRMKLLWLSWAAAC